MEKKCRQKYFMVSNRFSELILVEKNCLKYSSGIYLCLRKKRGKRKKDYFLNNVFATENS